MPKRPPSDETPVEPSSEEEVRARLTAFGGKKIKVVTLARECGWSRWKMREFVKQWQAASNPTEQIAEPKPIKKTKRAKPTPSPAPSATPEREPASKLIEPPVVEAEPKREEVTVEPGSLWEKIVAVILVLAGVTLGAVGLMLNVTYAQSLGRTYVAGLLLAVLGGTIDVLTILLPTVAGAFWDQRRVTASAGAWAFFVGVLMMTLIAASSFAATNIGDSLKERENTTFSRGELRARIDRLGQARSAITEPRSPEAIEAAIQQERARIPADVWKASADCMNVTSSARACVKVNKLRQAKADSIRRGQLDDAIDSSVATLQTLPAYGSADPGADMAAVLFKAASFGSFNITPEDVRTLRICGLAVMPAASGFLLFFASLTWRRGEASW
jgi:hypothetical protein